MSADATSEADRPPILGRLQIHASCVALDGAGLLLRGSPGAGKSDLALRLVDAGGALVADDLCEIRRLGDRLIADLPGAVDPCFRGRIEVRGIGFLTLPYAGPAPLILVADLQPASGLARLAQAPAAELLGLSLPLFVLDPFQISAVALLRLLAKVGPETIMRAP
jgi:HPr kinase/phosphorylase